MNKFSNQGINTVMQCLDGFIIFLQLKYDEIEQEGLRLSAGYSGNSSQKLIFDRVTKYVLSKSKKEFVELIGNTLGCIKDTVGNAYALEFKRIIEQRDIAVSFESYVDFVDKVINYTSLIYQDALVYVKRPKKIFISYARNDKAIAHALDEWLTKRSFEVYIDDRHFIVGEHLRSEIVRNMAKSEVVIFVYSKHSSNREWPKYERELAINLEAQAREKGEKPPRLIYVIIDSVDFSKDLDRERIVILAKGKLFPDVCEEIFHAVLSMPGQSVQRDLSNWEHYRF